MKTLTSIQAGAVALLTAAVGMAVAIVPSFAAYQQEIIGFGTAVVAFGFLVANSIHAHADAVRRPVVHAAPAPAAAMSAGAVPPGK